MTSRLPFSEDDLRAAIAESRCWADVCRFLGYGIKGDNYRTIKRWVERWGISTEHFDPHAGSTRSAAARRVPLEKVLVEPASLLLAQMLGQDRGEAVSGSTQTGVS